MSAVEARVAVQPLALGDELAGAEDELVAGHAASLGQPRLAGTLTPMANLVPARRPVPDLARGAARVARGEPRHRATSGGSGSGRRRPGCRRSPGRSSSTRCCASAGSTASASRSRAARRSGSRPAARARTGARGTSGGWRRCGPRAGCGAAGEAAYARRRPERTAIYSFEQQLAFDDEANAALDGADGARAFWDRQPPGLPPARDPLGHEREAAGDPREAPRDAGRGCARGERVLLTRGVTRACGVSPRR